MKKLLTWACLLGTLCAANAQAGLFEDIGYTRLDSELGVNLPDGTGVKVTQVEGSVDGAWIPDVTDVQFVGKTINLVTTGSVVFSAHANNMGKRLYGTISTSSPGILDIEVFEVMHWLTSGFLNTGGAATGISATRVANHSWTGDFGVQNVDVLRKLDFVVEVDEFIQAVAMSGTPSTAHVLSDSLNAIVVGMTQVGGVGTEALSSVYTGDRARPDIVAPESIVSAATPRGASAAALLVGYGHDYPSLSTDPSSVSTTNRNGDVIYNAERSETIKAVLMAGADRNTFGNTNSVDITDYRVDVANQTSNGLDKRYGAGQLNIYNSYHILNAREQNSAEDLPANSGAIANQGFDYDPSFGGAGGSNATATYSFSTNANPGQKLKADLVWNLEVTAPQTAGSEILYDLALQLIDVTGGGTVVASSNSSIDNTENIWFDLLSNRSYQLQVIQGTGSSFNWDYALAWQIVVPGVTVVETDSSTITAEDGSADTFTLALDSQPSNDVIISLTSSDTNEGAVLPSSLTFTSTDWSVSQTATVTGVNDLVDDGDKIYNINFSVGSVDTNYDGMAVASVAASNNDDDATFSFVDQNDVALNTLITSNTVVITGLLNTASISITDGEYSIDAGAYTSTSGSINNGSNVTLRTTSSATELTAVNALLTIGDLNDTFTVTTTVDTDADGVGDSLDNCTLIANNDQLDTDGDNYGNACDGDFNNDDMVNSLDISLFRDDFFKTGSQEADLNGDLIVNSLDLGLFKALFFAAPGPSGLVP